MCISLDCIYIYIYKYIYCKNDTRTFQCQVKIFCSKERRTLGSRQPCYCCTKRSRKTRCCPTWCPLIPHHITPWREATKLFIGWGEFYVYDILLASLHDRQYSNNIRHCATSKLYLYFNPAKDWVTLFPQLLWRTSYAYFQDRVIIYLFSILIINRNSFLDCSKGLTFVLETECILCEKWIEFLCII